MAAETSGATEKNITSLCLDKERIGYLKRLGRGAAWLVCALLYLIMFLFFKLSAFSLFLYPVLTILLLFNAFRDICPAAHALLNPEQRSLVLSVQTQRAHEAETPEELFQQIDADIGEDAPNFEGFYVGQCWVIGDQAMKLQRIRKVFTKTHTIQGRAKAKYELYLTDVDGNLQSAGFRKGEPMCNAAEYLKSVLPPDVEFGESAEIVV